MLSSLPAPTNGCFSLLTTEFSQLAHALLRIPLLEFQAVMGLFLSKSPSSLNTLSLPPLPPPERLLLPCRQKHTNTTHLIHRQRCTLCYSTSSNWLLSNCGDSYTHAQSLYIYVASYTTILFTGCNRYIYGSLCICELQTCKQKLGQLTVTGP